MQLSPRCCRAWAAFLFQTSAARLSAVAQLPIYPVSQNLRVAIFAPKPGKTPRSDRQCNGFLKRRCCWLCSGIFIRESCELACGKSKSLPRVGFMIATPPKKMTFSFLGRITNAVSLYALSESKAVSQASRAHAAKFCLPSWRLFFRTESVILVVDAIFAERNVEKWEPTAAVVCPCLPRLAREATWDEEMLWRTNARK